LRIEDRGFKKMFFCAGGAGILAGGETTGISRLKLFQP
jgi:hypothetical protein